MTIRMEVSLSGLQVTGIEVSKISLSASCRQLDIGNIRLDHDPQSPGYLGALLLNRRFINFSSRADG